MIVEMKIIATIFVEPRHPEKKFCVHWGALRAHRLWGRHKIVCLVAPSVSGCTSLRGCPTAS